MTTDIPFRLALPGYGAVDVHYWAGPSSVPGSGYLNDGQYPSVAHAFGRDIAPRYVGATVTAEADAPLRINRVPYRVRATFHYNPARLLWVEEYTGSTLRRVTDTFDADPTPGARRVWHDVIAPAILAHLASPRGIRDAADAAREADATLRQNLAERATALRAEADRLDGLYMAEPVGVSRS